MPNRDKADDTILVARVCAGDSDAFRLLVIRHGARFRMLAMRFTFDQALAEDVVQEAFISLWLKAGKFDGAKASFTTWFHRIVINKCLDYKRKRQFSAIPDGYDRADPAVGPEVKLAADGASNRLKTVLSALSERQKTAVILSYYSGLSNQEAAEVMQMNIKAYESLLVRSRAKMRKMLMAEKDDLFAAFA